MNYISIQKSLIPYRFNIQLAGETFTFEIHYNQSYDFFTCCLSKDGERIVTGEKIVYNQPLFTAFKHLDIPKVEINPFDRSGEMNRVTWENFEKEVFLYVRSKS